MVAISGFPPFTNAHEVVRFLATFGFINFFAYLVHFQTAYVEFEYVAPFDVVKTLNGLLWKFRNPLVATMSYAPVFTYELFPF